MSIRRVLHRLLNCWGRPSQDQGSAVTPSRGGDPSPATRRQFLTGLLSLPVVAVVGKYFPVQPTIKLHTSVGKPIPVVMGKSRLEEADGRIREIESALEYAWSHYSVQPDCIWMSPEQAVRFGFRTIEGPYYDPHYVGSFANSNV